jgi:hypothetical protein
MTTTTQLGQIEVEKTPPQEASIKKEAVSSEDMPASAHRSLGEEEFKAEEFEEEEREEQGSSHNKQVLCVTGIGYDNSQSVSEAQFDALVSYVGKKVSAEGVISSLTALNKLNDDFPSLRHDQGLEPAVQSQRDGKDLSQVAKEIPPHYLSQEEALDQRTATLTEGIVFDEKLAAQARYLFRKG